MPEKMYFCWERNHAGWSPVAYHREKPSKKMEGEPTRSAVYEVPPECIDEFGNPLFGRLQKLFAPPQEKEEDETEGA